MHRIVQFLACLIICLDCFSQTNGNGAQYPFVYYTPREGLVNNRARFIFQDSKGKLYFSTYGGLSVYDGTRFLNYTANDGLAVDLVNDIVEMGDDSIWVLTNGYKVSCIVNGRLKEFQTADNFTPLINQLLKASDGNYYAMADDGFFKLENRKFVKVNLSGITNPASVKSLMHAVEVEKKLYILYNPDYKQIAANILIYELEKQKAIAVDTSIFAYQVFNLSGKELWVLTTKGLHAIDKPGITENHVPLKSLPDSFQTITKFPTPSLFRDRQKNFWLATGEGVRRIAMNGETTLFTTSNGLPMNMQTSIFQDAEDNMWFTNEQTGACKLSNQQLAYYPTWKPNYSVSDIFIKPNSDSVWFFDQSHQRISLMHPDGKIDEYLNSKNFPIGGNFINANKKWLVSVNRVFKIDLDPVSKHYSLSLTYDGSPDAMGFSGGLADKYGNLVMASNKLVVITQNKILSAPINYLADQLTIDKDNRYWVAPRNNELYCFELSGSGDNEKLNLLKKIDQRVPGSPRSIAADQDGNIWLGTRDQGLYFLSIKDLNVTAVKQISTLNGLSANFVNYLYCDNDNHIWACTPSGVDRIKFVQDHFLVENITRRNNLYLAIQKLQQTKSGFTWILTSGGIVTYKPSHITPNNWKPHVSFARIAIRNAPDVSIVANSELKYNQNNLIFFLAAPTFLDEKQTRFSYILEGSGNENWSPPLAEASINFVNLPPGEYNLRVKATFLHGKYPDVETSFAFTILPPWWQTWWFKLAIGIVTLALALLALRYYIQRKLELQRVMLEKRRAIEKERTRIATDMHDDLGAGLSQIKFLSEMIGMRKQKHLPFEEEIDSIRAFSHEMIDKMGEIVWALNEKNDTLSDLLSYTRSYAAEYMEQNGIHCVVKEPDNIPTIDVNSEFRRNIYLTVKETLHNIVKHAQATEVIMSFRIAGDLIIQIKDNGKGIDLASIRSAGNGLISMHNRIEELNGRFDIANSDGTLVTIIVPFDK